MKGLAILAFVISTQVSANFNDMTLGELFERGYAIKATVNRPLGIVIESERSAARICKDSFYLRTFSTTEKSRIFKTNREFKIVRLTDDNINLAVSDKKLAIKQLWSYSSTDSSKIKLSELRSMCEDDLKLSIELRDDVQEAKAYYEETNA